MTEKPEVVSIDANIIVRYLMKDNVALSPKAAGILERVEAGETVVLCDPVNLAEVVWVLRSFYRMPRPEICHGLESLLKMEGFLVPNKDRYLLALRLFAESVGHFGDACACAAAREVCEGRLFSFDAKLSAVRGIRRFDSA